MTTTADQQLTIPEHRIPEEAHRVLTFLEERGAFHFPTLNTGLFSAAAGTGVDFERTGYRSVWVRDNVHIAHAHWVWGERDKAALAMSALMRFFVKHRHRLDDAIRGRTSPNELMRRPHIRFDGERLEELPEKWSHAQNDALGAFLWLYSKMARDGAVSHAPKERQILAEFVEFFRRIRFWEDEDSGHWEEIRKISASSIGVATVGLKAYRSWLLSPLAETSKPDGRGADELIQQGTKQLQSILPWECRQNDLTQMRRYDAALLFLIYPYQIVVGSEAETIANDVTSQLMGEYGIRRYLGDSYWCADYKQKMAADQRTADFSDNLAERNRLLQPGLEAQWCLFDPILSIHYGIRFGTHAESHDRQRQLLHLRRALCQLTGANSRFGDYRCPESYYSECGVYVPNDICPLLWTQANLKLALLMASGQCVTIN